MIGRSALMARSFLKPNVARNQLVRKSHDDGGVPGAVSKNFLEIIT